MAAEVHSDLSLIQDEDVLRRMWADTDDFGRKKEIRGRMYKLREQRLRDLYTGGVDRTQVTRKHQTTRHTESIGEQDFMSMKSKEIRDSESPTRDFSQAVVKTNTDNSGYWTSRQENANTTQQLEGGGIMRETVDASQGSGVIRGLDSETNLVLGSEDRHTVVSKNDDNSTYKAEELKHSSKMAATTMSNSGAVSSSKTENQNVEKSHEEKTSSDNSSTTKSWSSSSCTTSSKKIVSSSYQSSDTQNLKAITSDAIPLELEDSQLYSKRVDEVAKQLKTDSINQESRTSNVEQSQKSTSIITSKRYGQHTAEEVMNETSQVRDSTQKVSDSGAQRITRTEVTTSATSSDDKQSKANQIALAEPESTTAQESKTIVQQSHSDAVCKNEVVSSQATRAESVKSETESVTNHKIMTEIHKLDNYLSSHTPAPSTPASPRSTTDVAYWTIVSKDNRDNEFTYEPRSRDQDNQGPERPPSSPRSHEKVDKNLSNIDLPKGATEGQYVTTYQSHYTRPDRISIDNSPSHDYFASTLRTSPDRQTPSPTKKTASRSSLDRSSPERKWRQSPRTTSSPSVERASPDRPHSQPGQRSSPERKYRTSPSKSPERNAKKSPAKSPQRDVTRKSPAKSPERDVKERKHSTSSYTIERSSTESKKKSDVRTDTKPKRKFSSTQQKELTKIRASTPGSSPNSSPTRPRKVKDTSDSDSDTSQATFKKSKSDIVKSTDVCDSTVVKTVKQQKEESSEYFSEGSVTNEIVKRGKEPSPERSAFTPIKNFRTNPESGAFIVGEKRQIVLESEVVEKKVDQNRILTDVESAEIETAVEVTEVISENEDSVVDKKQITSPQVKTQAGPASPEKPDGKNVESRPGLAKPVQQSTESTVSEMNKTSVTKKSSAKGSTTKTKKEREELRRKAQTDSDTSRSASVSPERKVSSPKKSPGKPSQSPSRPSPQKTPVAEARKPSIKQDSKSPDRKQSRDGSLSPVRSIKSTKRTSKSPSTSPERSTSARSSPERKHTVSSSAKLSDFSSRTEERHTSVSKKSSSPQKTPPRLPDTFASKTPRRSSIPKSEKKLSPRNSKDNMQVKAGNRNTPHAQPAANQPALRPVQKTISQSPQKLKNSTVNRSLDIDQKRVAPKSSTTTRTVVTNKTTVKTTTTSNVSRASDVAKPIIQNGVRPAHPGTQRKPLATSNKKPASPATTPKRPSPQTSRPVTNTAKPTSKPAMTPTRVTPQKTIEKNPTSSLPSKSQVKTKPSMSLAKQDSKIKSKQFIEDEVHNVTSDLEDSVPPEYFDIEIVDTSRENIAQQKSGTKNTVLNARRVMNISQDRISHDRKLRKRDSIKDRDSPSLSSDDETDHAPSSTIKQDDGMNFGAIESTQDYLNVVVQHPKSSRESSPGYTSERIPVSTTSDDGESNPRYADFVSEPEDVEIFDNLRGPRGPIPLREDLTQRIDEEEVDILSRTSVADKVNVFMEAAKQSKETPETHQPIEIDSSHSVRSAKTLFENISKTQATTSQTIKVVNIYENNSEPVPETPNGTTQTVNVEANDKIRLVTSTPKDVQERLSKHQDEVDEPLSTKKQTYQERTPVIEPVILKKKAYETHKKEETTLFKEREIDESRKTTRKDTPVPEPLDTTTKPSKKPFERKPSASSADVNSKKNFFERKVQEQSKTVLKNTRDSNVSSLDKHQAEAKTSVNLDSLMRSTVASSVRAQSPDKVHKPVERKRTAENLTDKKEDVPAGKGRNVDTHRETSPLRDPYTLKVERKTSAEFTSARPERRQSSQSNEVPSYLTKTSSKPVDNDFGSPAKVRDTSVKKVSTSEEAMAKSTGKFGVTLKKSSSKTKMLPSTSGPAEKKPVNKELVEIEEIMDLEILEAMLVKAVAYEERRRIRAQIRLVKKQLEDEHNRNGNRIPLATPTKTKAWPPKEKSPERNVSALISSRNVKADSSWTSSSRRSPERKPSTEIKQTSYKETITTSSRESPERKLSKPKPRESPERYVSNQRRSQSPERIVHYPSRSSPERKTSNQIDKKSSDSKDITTYQATVKTQSTRSVTTSEVKTTSATDSITSSYGVGPTDDNGRPLFGLRALRRTDTSKTLEDGEHHEEDVVIEEKSESRRTSATSGDILDSTGRPLFGGLKALQSETMPTQTNQLSELVDRNTRLVQGETRMESTKTVMTSHSSMTSDGKVSVKRNVVRGELSAKNGEEPVGRVTQSTYSYSKDDRTAVPQITSKTVTSHIGGRRDSGPKIEEITDGSPTTSQSSRRYSKEYTVEEDNSTSTDRRNSAGLNEDNVRTFTSLIRNKDSSARKSSLESEETVLRSSKTSDESTRKTLTRGDSIKALQHKYQQATEAANQPTSRNYPKAGLILRSNSLHAADDHTKLSSNMKQVSTSSVQSTTGTSDLDGTTVTSTQTRTSEDSRTVRTSTAPVGTRSKSTSQTSTTVSRTEATTPLGGPTSFLDNSNKVTGVQDILQRMRNADLVSETGDTTEDTEARALLNKFLGASVILQGMEQGMRAAATQSSTTLVNEANKKLVKATDQRNQDDIYDITDEHQLQILLDASSDYDERKKLRARLREVMAEKKDSSESSEVVTKSGTTFSKTEVQTRVVSSSAKLTKANSIQSPFAKFKQLERQNSAPSVSRTGSFTLPSSASSIKERLLEWVQAQTRDYKNVKIDNFSTSWSDGLAFCALIHHFCPDAFDYSVLTPKDQRHNFQLAFTVAEEKADIYPLLDVEDMVMMSRPDWKCVFTYVQSIYRRFHDSPLSNPTNPYL